MNTLTGNNTRRYHFNPAKVLGIDGTFTIQRFAHRGHNAAEDCLANRHLGNIPGPFDNVTFPNMDVFTHNRNTHIIFLEVQHQSQDTPRELNKLQSQYFLQAVNTGDAVSNR